MTEEQEGKCHAIIHGHAIACGAGNLVPVPGLGVAADIGTMTMMTIALGAVFGANVTREVAKNMAIASLKKTVLKQPIKMAAKELSKLIPGLGQIVAPAIGAGLIEAAGWTLANQLDREYS
ncbi:MAG: hypothetical protein ACRC4W_02445 [Treponemataceae bacterium]